MKVVIKHPGKPAIIDKLPEQDAYMGIRHMLGLMQLASELSAKLNDPARKPFSISYEPPLPCVAVVGKRMFDNNDLIVYADDDGLAKKLPLNFYRPTDQSSVVGTVVAVKADADGNYLDMTDAEVKATMIMLDTWSKYSDHLDNSLN